MLRYAMIEVHPLRTGTTSHPTSLPCTWQGVFALQPIAAGERLIEYRGEVTSWRRAAARQRSETVHTFVFGLPDGWVIDGSRGGNSARVRYGALAKRRVLRYRCAPA